MSRDKTAKYSKFWVTVKVESYIDPWTGLWTGYSYSFHTVVNDPVETPYTIISSQTSPSVAIRMTLPALPVTGLQFN